jgi:hypothetical protein
MRNGDHNIAACIKLHDVQNIHSVTSGSIDNIWVLQYTFTTARSASNENRVFLISLSVHGSLAFLKVLIRQ